MTVDPVRASDALATAQQRVRHTVAALDRDGWSRHLPTDERSRLIEQGHFPQYSHELDWTAREVVGHLRDSAEIFTDRIRRILQANEPELADFVTDDPARLAHYRRQPLVDLLDELDGAQRHLRQGLASITSDQLGLRGRHVVDGIVRLADLVVFLPEHQSDHAAQLEALAGSAPATRPAGRP